MIWNFLQPLVISIDTMITFTPTDCVVFYDKNTLFKTNATCHLTPNGVNYVQRFIFDKIGRFDWFFLTFLKIN